MIDSSDTPTNRREGTAQMTTQLIRRTFALMAATGLLTAPHALAYAADTDHVRVESINIRSAGDIREVVVRTSKKPSFSVFRLTDPFRILLDVNNAEMANPVDLRKVDDGVISHIATTQFADEAASILRVEVALDESVPYTARTEGNSVVLTVGSERPMPSAPDGAEPASTDKAASKAPIKLRLGKVARRMKGRTALLKSKISVGALSKKAVSIEQLTDPSRLVIDVAGASIEPKWQRVRVNRHGVKTARIADKNGSVRFVLDLARGASFPKVQIDEASGRLEVRIDGGKAPAPKVAAATPKTKLPTPSLPAPAAPEPAAPSPSAPTIAAPTISAGGPSGTSLSASDAQPVATPQPQAAPAAAQAAAAPATVIQDVRFEPKDGFVRLTLQLADNSARVHKDGKKDQAPMLRIVGASLPVALERVLDVTEVAPGVVDSIATYNEAGTATIMARIRAGTEHRHWRKGNKLMWDFRNRGVASRQVTYGQRSTAGYSSAAMGAKTIVQAAPAQRSRRYTGRRISLDLKDADIQNVLRLLADVSKLNIVAAEDVKGKITIKLRNVPWDQALDIILRSKQLDKVRNGNIIRVAPIAVLQEEEELRVKRARARVQLEPLGVRLIPVSYAVAGDVAPQVRALLSDRGKVNIDKRTNVLVVEDIQEVLVKIERLVRTLDTQTPQVLIEARIVEARSNFSRELGIQWGGQVIASQATGNSTGLSFPNLVRVAGGADDPQNQVATGVQPIPNYAVNLPAAVGSGNGGALGFTLGSIGGSALVNIRLSAAEAEGKVKIISAPKVVTLDNATARILSGERIPITVITANGPSTRFIDAFLELLVTPHVTQDGSILMSITASKNEVSDRVDGLGTPGVIANQAKTAMIVSDGDTAVLGGIYRRTASENQAYVPWLGKIPVLGWLFKSSQRTDARDELLIFISPRIVNRSAALVNTN